MITLVLGGARSGKSRYAESRARASGKPLLYLATSERMDAEMDERIARHRQDRAQDGWETVEEPIDIASVITAHRQHMILVDCLTLWLGNLMHYKKDIEAHTQQLLSAIAAANIVLVGNEVGLGIVPDNKLARDFRDAAGILHQRIGAVADTIIMTVAGHPLAVKGSA